METETVVVDSHDDDFTYLWFITYIRFSVRNRTVHLYAILRMRCQLLC